MPTIYDLKPAFQRLLRPLATGLVGLGVRPNHVTVVALVLSALGGAGVLWLRPDRRALLVLPALLFVRMALNAVDGMMAREHGLTSPLGAMLNELGDVAADAALYLPLALWPGLPSALVVVAVVLGALTEMAGVAAVQIGASRRYDGPMGKSDRAAFFGVVALALGLGAPARPWAPAVFAIVVALLAATVVQRVRKALRELAA